MAQLRASSSSATPYATWVGITGGVIASSSLFLPVLIGTAEPHCSTLHCVAISSKVSLFSAWGVLCQITTAPSPAPPHIFYSIHFPAIILAPTFIAMLLLGMTVWVGLAPSWRWLSRLRLILAAVGLLYLLFEDVIAYFTYATQPPYVVPHPSVFALALALATMYGGYALIVISALRERRTAPRD